MTLLSPFQFVQFSDKVKCQVIVVRDSSCAPSCQISIRTRKQSTLMSKVKKKHEAADTTQWPKEKEQKDKRIKIVQIEQANPTQIGGTLEFSERVSSSCSNGGTRCVIVNDPVTGHEREKNVIDGL